MSTGRAPKARQHDIVIRDMDGETLVYDLRRHKAHCLNPTAAWVWKQCDGLTTDAELERRFSREIQEEHSSDLVRCALDQLRKSHLLDPAERKTAPQPKVTRRDLLRRAGIGAAVVPAVLSIVTPAAAQAGSRVTPIFCFLNKSAAGTCCTPKGQVCNWSNGVFGICSPNPKC